MRKILIFVLILYVISVISPTGLVYADNAFDTLPEYTEILRMDFNDVASVDATSDKSAFNKVYGDFAQLLTDNDNKFNYTIAPKTPGSSDKYIQLDTDYETTDGHSAIHITLPDGGFKANNGTYRISYDVRLNSVGYKPTLKLKTFHYAPTAGTIDHWGPTYNVIGPIKDDGTYNAQAPNICGSYCTVEGTDSSRFFATSWNNEDRVILSQGEWHRVDIKIDTVNLKAYYYYDSKYMGCQQDATFVAKYICGTNTAKYMQIQMTQPKNVGEAYQLDNIVISHSDSEVPDPEASHSYAKDFEEVYRLDFDNLENRECETAQTPADPSQFNTANSGKASIGGNDTTYAWGIYSKAVNGSDKYLSLTHSNLSSVYDKSVILRITPGEDAFPEANSGMYKISYDMKINDSIGQKPFVQLKTYHYATSNYTDYWGPCLSAVGPMDESGAKDWNDTATVYGTYSAHAGYGDTVSVENGTWYPSEIGNKYALSLGQWHNVEIIIDTDNAKADYYYDGVYTGTQQNETFAKNYICGTNTLNTLQFQIYQGYQSKAFQIDNITIAKEIKSDLMKSTGFGGISSIDLSEDYTKLTFSAQSGTGSFTEAVVTDGSNGERIIGALSSSGNETTLSFDNALKADGLYKICLMGDEAVVYGEITLGDGVQEAANDAKIEALSLGIKDENGGQLASGDTVTANAVLRNGTGEVKKALLILASYNSNGISQIEAKEIRLSKEIVQESFSITLENGKTNLIRAFLWGGANNCVPLIKPREYTSPVNLFETELDFESDEENFGFDSVAGNIQKVSADDSGNMLFFEKDGGVSKAVKNFEKTVSDNVLHLSFDYKTMEYINKFIVVLSESDGSSVKLLYDGGTLAYYPDITTWDRCDERAAYTPEKSMDIDIYLDFNSRTVYWYKDNVLYGSSFIPDSVENVQKVTFLNEDSQSDIYVDNIKIETLRDFDSKLPEELAEGALIDVSSENSGHIFFEKENLKFNVMLKNKLDYSEEYLLKYSVLNESKNTVYTGETDISMLAGEVKNIEISADSYGYGYYYLISELYDKSGNTLITKGLDYKFSVANIPGDGLKDENAGIQFTTRYTLDADDRYIDLPLMQKLGFGMVRGGGYKFEYVTEDGTFPQDKWMDKWYEACRDSGMTLLCGAAFGNPKITSENPPRSKEALEYFAQYAVDHCAYHEKIYGTPPEDMSVWNEYYIEGSAFNPDSATPADYANMLVAVYNAVKARYPTVKIWGMSGVGLGELEWTENVLKALPQDGKKYMDGVDVHPYANTSTPENADFVTVINNYKNLFAKYGYEDIEFFATEWGWPSVGKSGYPDEQKQASYFVRGNVINKANNLFEKISWYAINDIGVGGDDKENRFGFVKSAFAEIGYEAKPLYLAAANYNKLMIDAEYVDCLKPGFLSGVYVYRFKLRDGRDALVIWAHKYSETIKLNIDVQNLTMIDVYGNEQEVSADDNVYTVKAGVSPCYLVGEFTQYSKK